MKRILCFWVLLVCVACVFSQNTLVVIGEVEGVKDGVEFYLQETFGTSAVYLYDKNAPEGNGVVKDGRFVLRSKCYRKDSRHFLLFSESAGFCEEMELDFWADQGDTVYVKGSGNLLGNWDVLTDAPEQKELNVIKKACEGEIAAYQQACLDYHKYRYYRRETEMTESEWDRTGAVLAEKEKLRNKTKLEWYKKQLKVLKQLPVTDFWMDQVVTILQTARFYRGEFEGLLKELYVEHADKIDRKPDGKALREWVYPYPKAELGKIAVSGELFDVNGKKYVLEDFRGKYVLLDFWAQFCAECIAAFPQLEKHQERFAGKLVIISVSVDKIKTWQGSKMQKDITWYSLNDGGGRSGGLAGSYQIDVYPTYILIAPDGKYKARLYSSAIYDGELEKFLK